MSILVRGLLSVAGQYQVAKDAQIFFSGWVSIVVEKVAISAKVCQVLISGPGSEVLGCLLVTVSNFSFLLCS